MPTHDQVLLSVEEEEDSVISSQEVVEANNRDQISSNLSSGVMLVKLDSSNRISVTILRLRLPFLSTKPPRVLSVRSRLHRSSIVSLAKEVVLNLAPRSKPVPVVVDRELGRLLSNPVSLWHRHVRLVVERERQNLLDRNVDRVLELGE